MSTYAHTSTIEHMYDIKYQRERGVEHWESLQEIRLETGLRPKPLVPSLQLTDKE